MLFKKKLCPAHELPIKYICKSEGCKEVSRFACPECLTEGPHQAHPTYKLEELYSKFNAIIAKAKDPAAQLKKKMNPKMEQNQPGHQAQQGQQGQQFQQQPDLMFQAIASVTDKLFTSINKATLLSLE